MELIAEVFIELIFRRMIVGFFGYYTLYFFYKVFNNEDGIKLLRNMSKNEGEEFEKGCLIGVVGLISFSLLFILIGLVFNIITS